MKYHDLMKWQGNILLKEIAEDVALDEGALKIKIERCKVSDKTVSVIEFDDVVIEANPIEVDSELPIIELEFSSYVSYSVINESFAPFQDYEVYEGSLFRIYSKSRYLDFIKLRTFAVDIFPDLVHYQIPCLNHIIDIISNEVPIVTEINRYTMKRM
ncbi:hypothetical protein [Heyndrickxia vini]|uniref:Uncharacterized protein n=1 Tax=Heyndrickxia vini TaxID=1476025 RepID=A0ABX7DYT0_9BACI|nr:hypothetical protein [Heyndrickxia vini]QQZ08496.1 hypothetical protein I5776_15710 [Heyndrickxia vini]